MKESEARGKWCPDVRINHTFGTIETEVMVDVDPNTREKVERKVDHRFVHTIAVNRIQVKENEVSIPSQTKCITHMCMAWISSPIQRIGEAATDREGYCAKYQPMPTYVGTTK